MCRRGTWTWLQMWTMLFATQRGWQSAALPLLESPWPAWPRCAHVCCYQGMSRANGAKFKALERISEGKDARSSLQMLGQVGSGHS